MLQDMASTEHLKSGFILEVPGVTTLRTVPADRAFSVPGSWRHS
jgi:hypothetical protein